MPHICEDSTVASNRNRNQKPNMKLKVTLSHTSNPDVRGGYWEPTVDSRRKQVVEVNSIEEAASTCRQYIERNHLGGGNWNGGKVTDEAGKHVADISYNGRAWQPAPKGTLKRTEIKQQGMMTSEEYWSLTREQRDALATKN